MAAFNRVILMGNLTRDPEVRKAPSGDSVAELRLAVSESYRDRQTQQLKEVTCFVDVVVWGRQADLCQQYLSKGRPILVEGRLNYDEWKTPQGETRSKLRVRGERVQFLGAPPKRAEAQDGAVPGAPAAAPPAAAPRAAAPAAAAAPAPGAPAAEPAPAAAADSDDLPF
jgi:single-strand DNA-binding protein